MNCKFSFNTRFSDMEIHNIIRDIPTASKRRISQCLALANQIKVLGVEKNKLQKDLCEMENKLKLVQEEKDVLKKVVEQSKQP